MIVVGVIVSALAVALAWALAFRQPDHRPVALLLSVWFLAAVAARALDVAVLAPLRASLGVAVPWTGWARAAGLLANALDLLWPTALFGAALVVFAGKKPWAALAGWALAVAVFAVVHPIAGDGSQARALTTVQVTSVLVSVGLGIAWYRRALKAKRPASSAQLALAIVVTAEVVSIMGALCAGLFDRWPVSQVLYLSLFVMLVLMQGRFLWKPQPSA